MGKSSRNSLAAELVQPEGEAEDGSNGPGVLQGQDEFSNDGLVVLDARRRAARTEAVDARRRGSRSKASRPAGPNDIGEQISAQLRSLYDDVLEQPIPDRFLELLNKLETDNISPPGSRTPGER